MLWFNFILGSNFIFLCFKLIIIYYHTQNKIEPQHIHHNQYLQIVLHYFVTLFSPISLMSNTVDMIRVEKYVLRVVRVDKSTPVEKIHFTSRTSGQVLSTGQLELSSGKMHLISSLKGPHQNVAESNESYEWTELLSTRQKLICRLENCI